MQAVVGRRALEKQAASTNTANRFETEVIVSEKNLRGLRHLNTEWVDQAVMRTCTRESSWTWTVPRARSMGSRRERRITATSAVCAIILSFASTSSGTAKGDTAAGQCPQR